MIFVTLRDSSLKSELEKLEHNSELAFAWFEINYMKLNTDKCHLLISGNRPVEMKKILGGGGAGRLLKMLVNLVRKIVQLKWLKMSRNT